jgi:cation transport ATPase
MTTSTERTTAGSAGVTGPASPQTDEPHAPVAIAAPGRARHRRTNLLWDRRQLIVAAVALAGILLHLLLRFAAQAPARTHQLPLLAVLALGGIPLVVELLVKLYRRQFGSDLLAGISIVTSVVLGEYLAGSLVVLMLSGGEALEAFAVRSASSVLRALARRMPSAAHRKQGTTMTDIPLADVGIGDTLLVFPHEICPVDGVVVEGHGVMDEAYLTGEPFQMSRRRAQWC